MECRTLTDFVYLYGFVPHDAAPPADLRGVGGSSVDVVQTGRFRAAISRVPASEYDPARIETRLQDMGWVAAQGVAHERVVAWFVDNSEIVPAPLFTMYSGDTALNTAVEERADSLASEMQRLSNKREWDIKVSFDESTIEQHAASLSPRIAELDAEIAAASPGKRYLLARRRTDQLKVETRRAAHAVANEVLEAARSMVVEARALPIPKSIDDLPVIMHAALLVGRNAEDALIATLQKEATRLDALGMSLSFSGPWAPYRFTGDDERATAGRE